MSIDYFVLDDASMCDCVFVCTDRFAMQHRFQRITSNKTRTAWVIINIILTR